MRLWPFGSKKGEGGGDVVKPIGDVTDTQAFRTSLLTETAGKVDTTAAADEKDPAIATGTYSGELQRNRELSLRKDARATVMDTENIDKLVARYEKEFATADRLMQKRVSERRSFELYDYDGDRRFQQWKADRKQTMAKLKIHWIDECIQRPLECMTYMLRVFTTVGLFYGLGRTAYLYRTMDKVYAKLNGVSLTGIAVNEVSLGVVKGAVVSAAAVFGIQFGESTANMCEALLSGDPSAPPRSWKQITGCGAGAGLFAGAAFSAMHYKIFKPRFLLAMTGVSAAVGLAIGYWTGTRVYQPFADGREHDPYDPYWVPWSSRSLTIDPVGRITKYM